MHCIALYAVERKLQNKMEEQRRKLSQRLDRKMQAKLEQPSAPKKRRKASVAESVYSVSANRKSRA